MHDRDREVLAAVAKLNHDMGHVVLRLTATVFGDDRLSPTKLRELGAICDDLGALVDNLADEIDPPKDRLPRVIEPAP